MADHPLRRPEPFWQATGLIHGQQAVIRWQAGRWEARSDRPGLLNDFLLHLLIAGMGWSPNALPPAIGLWIDAAEVAARAAMPGPVVFDDNFSQALEPGQVN